MGLATLGALAVAVVLIGSTVGWFGTAAPGAAAIGSATVGGSAGIPPAPSSGLGLPVATPDGGSGPLRSAAPIVYVPAGRQLASSGTLVAVGVDGSLSLVDPTGATTTLAPGSDASYLFPAWSPDGTRLAVVRSGPDAPEIDVFDRPSPATAGRLEPAVIFKSSSIQPFYVAWTPDGRNVSFLASENGSVSLRVAPADVGAPLSAATAGAAIRSGDPFYFDWIGPDRLLVHIGDGPDALLGEIGANGRIVGSTIAKPGRFRAPVVSADGNVVGFVRAEADGSEQVVVAGRDGSKPRTMPVFGPASVSFAPTGHVLASIGPTAPNQSSFTIPYGPVRLLDGDTGRIRTLVDGSVVSAWWSPDGRRLAAVRVQPVADASAGAGGSAVPATAAPSAARAGGGSPSATPDPATTATEIRLLFVDVASGKVRSDAVIHPEEVFIDQFLTFFDQYAVSHQLWSPDSSSLLVPVYAPDGSKRIEVLFANGDEPIWISGTMAFWSP